MANEEAENLKQDSPVVPTTLSETDNQAEEEEDYAAEEEDVVVETLDEQTFLIPKFFLQSASAVLMETLASSSPSQAVTISISESSPVVNVFLAIIQHAPGILQHSPLDFWQSSRVYQLADKYQLHQTFRPQIHLLLRRHIPEEPFKVLALACDREKVDLKLSVSAIQQFLSPYTRRSDYRVSHTYKQYVTTWQFTINPSNWSNYYINQCGTVVYSSYVGAYIENCSSSIESTAEGKEPNEAERTKLMAKIAESFRLLYNQRSTVHTY